MKTLARTIACLLLLASAAEAAPKSLREALAAFQFDSAATAAGSPALDRELFKPVFGRTADDFVAIYGFQDELAGSSPRPLHVSYYDRRTDRWAHTANLEGVTGAVLAIQVGDSFIVVDSKQTPSAGTLLVLDKEKLKVVATLPGYFSLILPNDLLLISRNMDLAPIRQERLLVFDLRSGRQTEIFPLEQGDFNLDVGSIAMRPDRGRFVFLATYDFQKPREATPPQVQTVVRCDSVERVWSCKERKLGASDDPDALLREEMRRE